MQAREVRRRVAVHAADVDVDARRGHQRIRDRDVDRCSGTAIVSAGQDTVQRGEALEVKATHGAIEPSAAVRAWSDVPEWGSLPEDVARVRLQG